MPETSPFNAQSFTHDSRHIWNQAAPHYDEISRRLFAPITEIFLGFAQLQTGETALDLACGTGGATSAAAKAVGASGKVVGADFSAQMLKIAAQNISPSPNLATVEFREMDAQALDFPPGSFDAVICQLGLMLFAQPAQALKEMARVVKAQGRVSCLVQGEPDKMLFTSVLNKTLVRYAPELKIPGAPTIYDFGPPGVLEKSLGAAGLAKIESRRCSGVFHFASMQEYWEMMSAGAGKTGVILKNLDAQTRLKVQQDVFQKAAAFERPTGFEIPYEFVMASGAKP